MFNEKNEEFSRRQNCNIPVWQSAKYIEAKAMAIQLIKSKKYGLLESDFWILMNETKTGKMGYTGLIISHNGCLKINDNLANKFDTSKVTIDKDGWNNSLVYTYIDDEVYEIGEVSSENCKNDYPYAMALKRCFDRVVLKKSKLAYAGVYSDSEADEFSGKDIEITEEKVTVEEKKITEAQINIIKANYKDRLGELLEANNLNKLEDMRIDKASELIKKLSELSKKQQEKQQI